VLSTHDSRGAVEPLAALAVELRARGVEVQVCAPPDDEFVELLGGAGVSMVPLGDSWRAVATALAPSEADVRRHLDGLIAAQFDTMADVAQGCDLLLATGFPPVAAGARSLTEQLGIHYVYASYQPTILPSPHHMPPTYYGQLPPGAVRGGPAGVNAATSPKIQVPVDPTTDFTDISAHPRLCDVAHPAALS